LTETIYLEVQNECEDFKEKRRVSVSKVLNILGVSRSGYNAWMHHLPSNQQKRMQSVKVRFQKIYDQSYQNYGAPKITKEIQKHDDHPVSYIRVSNAKSLRPVLILWSGILKRSFIPSRVR